MAHVREGYTWGWTARAWAEMALILLVTCAVHLPFQYYVPGLSFEAAAWATLGVSVGGLCLGLTLGYRTLSVDDEGLHLHPVLPWRATLHHSWESLLEYGGNRLELPRMTGWYTRRFRNRIRLSFFVDRERRRHLERMLKHHRPDLLT